MRAHTLLVPRGNTSVEARTMMSASVKDRRLRRTPRVGGREKISALGSCRAGMAWKTAESRKCGKMGKPMGKQPPAEGAKNGEKKRIFEGAFFHCFSSFGSCFCLFLPLSSWGCFPFGVPFCPHFLLLAVFHTVPRRHDPKIG